MAIKLHQASGLTADVRAPGSVKSGSLTHQELDDNFNSMWPIGSIYINATTPTNPKFLMGFGEWESFGLRQILVGHNDSPAGFDQNDSPNQIRRLIDTNGSKDTTLSKEIKNITAGNGELSISFYSAHNFSKGQRVTVGGVAKDSGTYPSYGLANTITVTGSSNTNYNGTYLFSTSEDIWYNSTNPSAASGTKGFFFFSDSANRWQFGSTNANAKATGDTETNAYLDPSMNEATGFWTVNTNSNWQAGNTTVRDHVRLMSFTLNSNVLVQNVGTVSIVANTSRTIGGTEYNIDPNGEKEILHTGMGNYSCPRGAITLRYVDPPPPNSIITDPIPGPSGQKTKLPGDGTVTFFGTLYNSSPVGNTIGERMGTGGSFTHVLSELEIPEHEHLVNWKQDSTDTNFSAGANGYDNTEGAIAPYPPIPIGNGAPISTSASIFSKEVLDAQGGYTSGIPMGKPHNNMMPFITAYFWRRKA